MNPKDALILIEYIRKNKLNDNEASFINSIEHWAKTGGKLSGKQAVCLQGIYAKVTGGGQYERKEYIK